MEFTIGDDVVHPNYGLGSIVRMEERELANSGRRWYYVLAIGTSTVWMPKNTDGSTTLRAVTRKQDLEQYRAVLSGPPVILERDHKKRHLDLSERLAHGSFRVMCEAVRDLSARGWDRPMSEADAALLKKVRDSLCQEWAAAAGQSYEEALHEVEDLLRTSRATRSH
jgi:RNA polymerase-interacting CarD/CdnL/TRCF family regulator